MVPAFQLWVFPCYPEFRITGVMPNILLSRIFKYFFLFTALKGPNFGITKITQQVTLTHKV